MAMAAPPAEVQLLADKHVAYIVALDSRKESFEYWVTEHLKVQGLYWGATALELLRAPKDALNRDAVVAFLKSCQHESGGFGGNVDHDPHLLSTLSAIQILAMYDRLAEIDTEAVVRFVRGLQQPDGSFAGDVWGEIDTRFSYCALSCLSLLKRLDAVNVPAAIDFILKCKNFDGGFGSVPGAESHAGQIFCCVGALSIVGALHHVDADLLGWWIAERQLQCGGLNGRPEKLEDVCYSWWCLSAMAILRRLHWIDAGRLIDFILSAQDPDHGGIADRPGDVADVFHTLFGISGLSLLGYPGLAQVDPTYCMPTDVIERMGLARDSLL